MSVRKVFDGFPMKMLQVEPEGEKNDPKAYIYFLAGLDDQAVMDLELDKLNGVGLDRMKVAHLRTEYLDTGSNFSFFIKEAVGEQELLTDLPKLFEAKAERMVSLRLQKNNLTLGMLVKIANPGVLYELRKMAGKEYDVTIQSGRKIKQTELSSEE